MPEWLEEREGAIRLRLRVQPRASRTEVVGEHGNALKVRVASPPVDGAANEELERYLTKRLGLPRSSVRVIAGATSRTKMVQIEGVGVEEVLKRLTTDGSR